jgi:hypothetical protein
VTDSAQLYARPARFRSIDLGHLPTSLEPMERLSKYVGGPSLWVKRDDGTDLGLGQQSKGVATELKQDAARIQLGRACRPSPHPAPGPQPRHLF